MNFNFLRDVKIIRPNEYQRNGIMPNTTITTTIQEHQARHPRKFLDLKPIVNVPKNNPDFSRASDKAPRMEQRTEMPLTNGSLERESINSRSNP